MIAVFAYDFPHKKTQDFLETIYLEADTDVAVFAAPYKFLPSIDRNKYWEPFLPSTGLLDTKAVCDKFGFEYFQTEHNNQKLIQNIVETRNIQIGFISGARILKLPIIQLFRTGIFNLHPGKLPETAGLDALFYTIKNNIEPGVTAHFINEKVDSGRLIEFEPVSVTLKDTLGTISEKIYLKQLEIFKLFLRNNPSLQIETSELPEASKNTPMLKKEKYECIASFEAWKTNIFYVQMVKEFIKLCAYGDEKKVGKYLAEYPFLLEVRNDKGWTPLISACYHQQVGIVRLLLECGADPNSSGRKGTTPLMYAKTKIDEKQSTNFELLEILISFGAALRKRDNFDKDIFDYLAEGSNVRNYLREKYAIL